VLLHGSEAVFRKVKGMVAENGVPEKLALLEKRALKTREEAEISLLNSNSAQTHAQYLNLFYTREEGDEIY
jgi:hypothetical protein